MDWKEALGKLNMDDFPAPEEQPVFTKEESDIEKETLHIFIDRKQRKGKTATIVEGFLCGDEQLKVIARDLKMRIGVGGSARCGEILLQGDCAAKLRDVLTSMGYKVK